MKTRYGKLVGVTAALMALLAGSATAATPDGTSPPTYVYDNGTAGTQPPRAPALVQCDYRSVRTYQVTFTALVPRSQLQAVLPAGFTALPAPLNSTTSSISLAFFADQRFERVGAGSFGPVSAVLVSTTATNTNLSPPRPELVFPAFEASGEVDALNDAFGPGSARLADVSLAIKQTPGRMEFSFRVKDELLDLKLSATASSPSAINLLSISDPVGIVFRTLNDGRQPNWAFRAASQSDTLTLPSEAANAHLKAVGNKLRLPAGVLALLGVGTSVTFARNVEFIVAFE